MEAQLRRLGPHSKIKVLRKRKSCGTKIWLCGRGKNCQIHTKSKYASRRHFRIIYKNFKYFIKDLNSANGTYLNDEKIREEQALTLGSTIGVGVPPKMFNSPDCVIYKFEPKETVNELNIPEIGLEQVQFSEDEVHLLRKLRKETEEIEKRISDLQNRVREESRKAELDHDLMNGLNPRDAVNFQQSSLEVTEPCKIQEPNDKNTEKAKVNETVPEIVLDVSSSSENMNGSVSTHEIVTEELGDQLRPSGDFEGPRPPKIQKIENLNKISEQVMDEDTSESIFEEEVKKNNEKELNQLDEEDLEIYEVVTQVDKSQPVSEAKEPDLLIYSQTEKLIEIEDNEDADIVSNWKPEEAKFDSVEDDDVVFLQTIIRSPKETPLPVDFQIGDDDFTDTDKKWFQKLSRVKEKEKLLENSETSETSISAVTDNANTKALEVIEPEPMIQMDLDPESLAVPNLLNGTAIEKAKTIFDSSAGSASIPMENLRKEKQSKKVRFNLETGVIYFEPEMSKPILLKDITSEKQQFLRIVFNLCNWNAQWLKECNKVPSNIHPPGLCDHRCRKVRNNYLNHSHYLTTFVPNMLYQIWENIKEKWINSCNFFRQTISFDNYTHYPTEKLTVWNCTGLVRSVDGHKNLLREGHVVILRVHQATQPSTVQPNKYSTKVGYLIFGIIESKTYEKFTDQKIHPKLAEKTAALNEEFYMVKLEILVKLRPHLKVDKEKLVQVTVLHQISLELRRFRGICYLPLSGLCNAIVKLSEFQLPEPASQEIVFKGPMHETQKEIVLKLTQACLSMNLLLYGIYGAAGTGKSHVVIALIWQLLLSSCWSDKKPKIIYCTQDGAPLDDMVLRLKNSMSDQNSTFNLVRVSCKDFVKQEIRDFCLFAQSKSANKCSLDREAEILKKADVICISCTSPVMGKLIKLFGTRNKNYSDRKMVCIIDEAVSTRETDSIIPLLLGVTHLILVGDVYQAQPSSTCKVTKSLGVDNSLFLRIYQHYRSSVEKQEVPFFPLKTQFRMRSDLSRFLNRHIYTKPFIVPRPESKDVSFRSHLLLVDAFEPTDKVHQTKHENFLARKLVWELFKIHSEFRYAVITCGEDQSQNLRKIIGNSKVLDVEVDKVQAFHGREFDVVVFLYDGSDIHSSVIATALTRAKISLFIVSLKQSLGANSWFRLLAAEAEKRNYMKYIHSEMSSDEFQQILTA